MLERARDYCVYVHTNRVNGKKYVGMTKNIKQRWRNGGKAYRECPHFYSAIQKYGWDNFDHDIVQDELTHTEACELEIKLIEEWETIGEKGYNLATGGSTAITTTPEQRKIHSQYMSEKNSNPETNPLTNGKVVWGETHPYPTAITVEVIEKDGTVRNFQAIKECGRYYNIPETSMRRIFDREQPYIPHKLSKGKPHHEAIEGFTFRLISKTVMGKEVDEWEWLSNNEERRGSKWTGLSKLKLES